MKLIALLLFTVFITESSFADGVQRSTFQLPSTYSGRTSVFGESVKVLAFSSVSANGSEYACSATLLNYAGACHLLTNNHCVENKTNFRVNFIDEKLVDRSSGYDRQYATSQYASSDNTDDISVSLKKVNHRLDLAILSFSNEALNKECQRLPELTLEKYNKAIEPELVKVFAAVGIVDNKPSLKFSSDLDWSRGYGATQVFNKYDVGDGLYFWNVSDIDIIPGMSGSPVISNVRAVLGIASKYVDYQSRSLIIPLPMIFGVLDNKIIDLPEVNLSTFNNQLNDAGNEHGGAGNEHGGAGNEHGGAGNEPGGAGGSPKNGALSSFRAPDEGIVIKNEVMLGFASKDGIFGKTYYHQIDGRDEYQVKVNDPSYLSNIGMKGKIEKNITRPVNGSLDLDLRKSIFDRFEGVYVYEDPNDLVAKPFNQNFAAYEFDSKARNGLRQTERQTALLMFDINSKENLITIESQYLNIDFKISHSEDYKQIYLMRGNVKMVCDNKNLLKLICTGDGIEFSLSMNNTGPKRHIKYRLAYIAIIEGKKMLAYWHGAVLVAPTKNWRK